MFIEKQMQVESLWRLEKQFSFSFKMKYKAEENLYELVYIFHYKST